VATERKRKDNSRKHPGEREMWQHRKREGRLKQVWVWDDGFHVTGHWERQKAAAVAA
jgi:hypothetical protein